MAKGRRLTINGLRVIFLLVQQKPAKAAHDLSVGVWLDRQKRWWCRGAEINHRCIFKNFVKIWFSVKGGLYRLTPGAILLPTQAPATTPLDEKNACPTLMGLVVEG